MILYIFTFSILIDVVKLFNKIVKGLKMMLQANEIDMLHGSLIKKIIMFTVPIAVASMLQQLFNAADSAIIGLFDSSDSLAAVGTNGEIVALIISLSSGLSLGVNVLIAECIGRQDKKHISPIIQTSLLFSILFGILIMIIGQFTAIPLLRLIQTPNVILAPANMYLKIYFIGYPFLLIYDFGSATLRARGDSRYPFIALTLAGIINVTLNILFVALFHLSVIGVALATVISTIVSAAMVIYRLMTDNTEFHLSLKGLHIQFDILLQLLKVGIPAAIQGAVFCFANIFVQSCVNEFGADAIAGSTIAMNFEYFAYYVITAFGQTATTFSSQNYAAKQIQRCKQILGLCMLFSFITSVIIILPILLFPDKFSSIFTNNTLVIENARIRIMHILLFEIICSFYEIPAGILRGIGHPVLPAIATVVGTCIFRVLWIFTIFRRYHSLRILYMAFPISWILTIILIGCSFVIILFRTNQKTS